MRSRFTLMFGLGIAGLAYAAAHAKSSNAVGAASTVLAGSYTDDQAVRGKVIYQAACAGCHGRKLDGAGNPDMPTSPAIAGAPLVRVWQGKNLGELFAKTKTTMPLMDPRSLTDQQYSDTLAFMLKSSGFPAGSKELPTDEKSLSLIAIVPAK